MKREARWRLLEREKSERNERESGEFCFFSSIIERLRERKGIEKKVREVDLERVERGRSAERGMNKRVLCELRERGDG